MNIPRRKLGNTLFNVNPIGLGSAYLAIEGRPSDREAIKIICKALDAGIEVIDTSDAYCLDHQDMGYCERLIAKALKEWQGTNSVVVTTKGGVTRLNGAWGRDGRPEYLRQACEASLKALDVDCIDLYQLHAPDSAVPFLDSVGALADLKQAGKIRHVGLSNVSVSEIKSAQQIVDIVSIQNLCNPYNIEVFNDGILEYCEQEGLAFFPYSPVGGATQKHLTKKHPVLLEVAKQYDASPYQIILAWLLEKSPVMIPIPGASKMQSALDSAAAMNMQLSKQHIADIDNAFSLKVTVIND